MADLNTLLSNDKNIVVNHETFMLTFSAFAAGPGGTDVPIVEGMIKPLWEAAHVAPVRKYVEVRDRLRGFLVYTIAMSTTGPEIRPTGSATRGFVLPADSRITLNYRQEPELGISIFGVLGDLVTVWAFFDPKGASLSGLKGAGA